MNIKMKWKNKKLKQKLLLEVSFLFIIVTGFLSVYNYHRYHVALSNFSNHYLEETNTYLMNNVSELFLGSLQKSTTFLRNWIQWRIEHQEEEKEKSFKNDAFVDENTFFKGIMLNHPIGMIIFDMLENIESIDIFDLKRNVLTITRPLYKKKSNIYYDITINRKRNNKNQAFSYYFNQKYDLINHSEKISSMDETEYDLLKKKITSNKKNFLSIQSNYQKNSDKNFFFRFSSCLLGKEQEVLCFFNLNIDFTYLSSILKSKKNKFYKSHFFIMDEDNQILASSNNEVMKIINENQKIKLEKIEKIHQSTLSTVMQQYNSEKKEHFYIEKDGKKFVVHVTPFSDEFITETKRKWKMACIFPFNELFQDFSQISDDNLIIYTFVFLLIIIEIILISRRIGDPLTEVIEEANRLRLLDLSGQLHVNSSIEEIHTLVNALKSMKSGLASYQKYMPKTLVRRLIEKQEDVLIGGEAKNLTVLFCDIEGFTTVAESMSAENLILHLSNYFEHMTQIVLDHKGTIDKYIGDAIMAFWGAPEEDEYMSINACKAALYCQHILSKLNHEWKEKNLPVLNTRFGIHHGELIVGNIGSSERMNYTVIGDTVNTASRLEGVNKFYDTKTIISQEVFQHVRHHFLCRPLDIISVVGRVQGLKIYELIASLDENDPLIYATPAQIEFCALFTTMMDFYLNMNFSKALEMLEKMVPYDYSCQLSIEMYEQRCKELMQHPPEGEWDPTHHFTHK
jgi:class 3 adenylate cyclase